MNLRRETRVKGHPVRTTLVRFGITMAFLSGAYLALGALDIVKLEMTAISWNNIRVVGGVAILACLLTAGAYGDN